MHRFLSYEINPDTPIYGGGDGFLLKTANSIKKGDSANTQTWKFPNHLGTHVDVPYHFYGDGQTIDFFSPDFWVFNRKKSQVLEVDLKENDFLIKPGHVKKQDINRDVEFLMIKTGFGRYRNMEKYYKYNPGLSLEISDWIIEKFRKLRILGIDSISISSWQHRDIGRQVHKKMLNPKKPILPVEDMNLSDVSHSTAFKKVVVAPLIITKSDGGPVTIIAEE